MEDLCNVRVSGVIDREVTKSFSVDVYSMYIAELKMERHSGEEDLIKLNIKEDSVSAVNSLIGKEVVIDGELRTYKRADGGSETCLLVHGIVESEEKVNYAKIIGTPVKLRATKNRKGIKICEARVEIKGKYNKMSRVTVVGWGSQAEKMANMKENEKLMVEGRVQSRQMVGGQNSDNKTVEVTVKSLDIINESEQIA